MITKGYQKQICYRTQDSILLSKLFSVFRGDRKTVGILVNNLL